MKTSSKHFGQAVVP